MQKRFAAWLAIWVSMAGAAATACSGDDGAAGPKGDTGPSSDGGGCSVSQNADGSATIKCDDGTSVTVPAGTVGDAGSGCTVADNGNGTKTITCGDGTSVVVSDGDAGTPGNPGNPGNPGLGTGQTPGLEIATTVTPPANGTDYAANEKIVVKYEMKDKAGNPLKQADFSQLRLMMAGPRAPLKSKTAVKLMKSTNDRTDSHHHYVDLITTTNTNLAVSGNVLTYTMEPITDEEAGTYTIGLWAVVKAHPEDQTFDIQYAQIKTATVEPDTVKSTTGTGCDSCHKGAANGKYYMHHIDPGFSPFGNPSIDSAPLDTCRTCHNTDGYAGVQVCADGSKPVSQGGSPPVYKCADGSTWSATATGAYLSDSILRRVHGVHMGEGLLSKYNTDPVWGDFEMYLETVFPKDVRNCTTCHQDDAWKNNPTRVACGACHDSIDWADGALKPPRVYGKLTGGANCATDSECATEYGAGAKCNTTTKNCERQSHAGGAQANDANCKTCHQASSGGNNITDAHAIADKSMPYTATVTMSAPATGSTYKAGDKPLVTIVIKGSNGNPIDHTTVLEGPSGPNNSPPPSNCAGNWSRSYVFVNGPRSNRVAALTTGARAEATSANAGNWDLTSAADLQLKVGPVSLKIATPTALKKAGVTPADVKAWLNGNASFSAVAFAELAANSKVTILAKPSARQMDLEFVTSDVATVLGFSGTFTAQAASTSYAANPIYRHQTMDTPGNCNSTLTLAPSKDDPKVTWATDKITYQLDDVATVAPGTYTLAVKLGKSSVFEALINFQVGTDTVEKKIATNCLDCHLAAPKGGMHSGYNWDADLCAACHDNRRGVKDRLAGDTFVDGWGGLAASNRSNMGFGAAPLSRRVHGMHFAAYVEKPAEIHVNSTTKQPDIPLVIFPQDVRNCVKCHSESDSWKQKPARLPCLGCHDSDAAQAHGDLMTADPTPADPWNGDEKESCATCHGPGKDFSVENVHNITNPYKPPYPR